MKTIALFLIIISSGLCYADSIHFGFYTTHFKQAETWNNENNLLAIETNNYVFASFTNSHGFPTYLAGYEFSLNKYISVIPSISYGYDARCLSFIKGICSVETYASNIIPLAALKISHDVGPLTLSIIGADYVNASIGFNF